MGRRERDTYSAFQTLVTDIGVLLTEEEAALLPRLPLFFFLYPCIFTTCVDNESRKKYTPAKMQFLRGETRMRTLLFLLKLLLKILLAPIILLLTLAVWLCTFIVYVSGLVLGFISMTAALLGVAVLVTYSPKNGFILLLIAFIISPFGLPKLAFWLLGKVQNLKFTIQDRVYK